MANEPTSFGELIRAKRIDKDLTLRELARRLSIIASYLSDIENDRRIPAEGVLNQIAQMLDIPVDELMALTGRLSDSVERYLKRTPAAGVLFRRISQANLQDDALRRLTEAAEKLEADE